MADYKFKGLPLTATIIEELIIQLYNGQTVKRAEIIKATRQYHTDNGGLENESAKTTPSVKKALKNLKDKGHAENRTLGNWDILYRDRPIVEKKEIDKSKATPLIDIENKYGYGANILYCYYFPTYKKLADLQNNNTWPCKIGRTDGDPRSRILGQSTTAMPEYPKIPFIVNSNDAITLENMIHTTLTLKKKKITVSPGNEWFNTSPEEVLNLIKTVDPNILK